MVPGVPTEPGTRVFTVRSATDTEVVLFGFGTYVGDRPRPGTVPFADLPQADRDMYVNAIRDVDRRPLDLATSYDALVADGTLTAAEAGEYREEGERRRAADLARPIEERAAELHDRASLNPCIELDDGGVVWGCECWWAPAEQWDAWRAGRSVRTVPVPVRAG